MIIKITTQSDLLLPSGNIDYTSAIGGVIAMHGVVPLLDFMFSRVSLAPGPLPQEYHYRISAADGRIWRQRIEVDLDTSRLSFQVPDFWKLSEFSAQRDPRDRMIDLARKFSLSLFKIEFT